MEKIAILMSHHNHGDFVEEAIDSAREAQIASGKAGMPIEIHFLIGDDLSDDGVSRNILHAAADKYKDTAGFHVSVTDFPVNRKPNAVLCDLIRATPKDCAYTVVLDSDDELKPTYFPVMLHAMHKAEAKNDNIRFVYSNNDLTYPNGEFFKRGISRPFNRDAYQANNSYIPSTSLMQTDVLREAIAEKDFPDVDSATKYFRYKQIFDVVKCDGLFVPVAAFNYRHVPSDGKKKGNVSAIGNKTLNADPEYGRKLSRGEYYLPQETRMSFPQYLDYLQKEYDIDTRELSKLAGGELQYGESEYVCVRKHDGTFEKDYQGVVTSRLWSDNIRTATATSIAPGV